MHILTEKNTSLAYITESDKTYKVICSCICFLFDFLVSVLPSDSRGDGTRVVVVAVNNTTRNCIAPRVTAPTNNYLATKSNHDNDKDDDSDEQDNR